MNSREEFEKWVNNPHMINRMDCPKNRDEYAHPWTAGAWKAWQAARAWKKCGDELPIVGEPVLLKINGQRMYSIYRITSKSSKCWRPYDNNLLEIEIYDNQEWQYLPE